MSLIDFPDATCECRPPKPCKDRGYMQAYDGILRWFDYGEGCEECGLPIAAPRETTHGEAKCT